MFNRSIAFFITAITLYGSAPLAKANLLGMPMNLGLSIKTLLKARSAGPGDACVVRTDDVFAGPLIGWTRGCGA
jgi:hypothetical protein